MTLAVHVDQTRDESMLGASECAGVLGLDKYNPPIKIWRRHRGLAVRDDGDNEAAYWGTVLEPVIRGKYAHDRKAYVYVPSESSSIDGWLRATPDGFVWEGGGPGQVSDVYGGNVALAHGLLQVKTCSAWLEDDWRDGPPAKYEVQCRVEMAVCGLPWNDIVCLCGGQKQLGPYRIERDLEIENRLIDSLREFWGMVQSGREPTPDHTDAWRMHVSEKMERAKPATVEATEYMAEQIAEWREARALRKRAIRGEDTAKNKLLLALSAAGATKIDCGDRRENVTAYKTKGTWALRTPTSWKDD